MKRIKILGLFLFCFSLVNLSAQTKTSGLSGKVKESESDRILTSVHVQLSKIDRSEVLPVRMSITDTEGMFKFNNIEAGEYQLTIRHIGYVQQSMTIELKSGESLPIEFFLDPGKLELGEVSVVSLRYNKSEREVPLPIEVITKELIPQQSAMSLADIASKEAGIALYRDGVWATSLSIRGLGENRLVSMVNGNRIETSNDLAGGLSMIDVHELERIEIIKGAASSVYGTGAMGGVVNMVTRKGNFQETSKLHGEATTYYEGVNKLLGTHIGIQSGGKKWYLRVSGGYRQADDIKTPEGILDNSQFSDYNYNASIGFKPFKNHKLEFDFQDFTASDVGIPGGAPLAPSATATYKTAERRMFSGNYTINRPGETLREIRLKYFNQYIFRDVELIPNSSPVIAGNKRITANLLTPVGAHFTNGLSFETDWKLSDNHTLLAGVDYWQREVETSREKYITQEILDDFQMVVNTLELIKGEKPIPDSRFSTAGLFVQDEISLLDEKLDVLMGARLDGIQVYNEEAKDPIFLSINGIEMDPVPGQRLVFEERTVMNVSWSMNAGGIYHLTQNMDATLNLGRSFRSASLEERFKYIDLGSKVRLGNPDLKPEKGWFSDLGFRIWNDNFTAQVNGYAHYLTDMIIEMPGEFIYNESDTLPALINSNVDQALLYGFEAKAEYILYRNLVLQAQSSYVRGMDLKNDADLPLIAPYCGVLGIRYSVLGVFNAKWQTKAVAAQNKIAEGESVSKGYLLSDFSLYTAPRNLGPASFQLFFGVDNVFNADYINHLTTNRGIVKMESGRNVFVKLQMKF